MGLFAAPLQGPWAQQPSGIQHMGGKLDGITGVLQRVHECCGGMGIPKQQRNAACVTPKALTFQTCKGWPQSRSWVDQMAMNSNTTS